MTKGFSEKELRGWLPKRPPSAHKGDFGHALIVAGSRGMTGAAVLAARGALRSGCGLVTVACPLSQQPIVAAQLAEAMTFPLPESAAGTLRAEAVEPLLALHKSRNFTVMALGPGLTTQLETARVVLGLLSNLTAPAVIDADALNILSMQPQDSAAALLKRRKAPYVFTPHPGELARLLKHEVSGIASDRAGSASELCSRLGGVCLLKGHGTVVTDGSRLWTNATGNNGLAKGGTGDALTGLIAGLWSQRLRAAKGADTGFEAAALGAYLHGAAADLAVREKTPYALLASDVIEALPAAFRKLA